MPHIAHTQIRNRGTLGGSLAHADPAAELPAVMVALDAHFHLASLQGQRMIPAADFYQGLFTTALEPDEMLVQIDIPALPPGSGWSFHEFARRHGDYAIVGVAAVVQVGRRRPLHRRPAGLSQRRRRPHPRPQGRRRARWAKRPRPRPSPPPPRSPRSEDIDPLGDIHASVAYRRHLVEVLGRRALADAFARATMTPSGKTTSSGKRRSSRKP